MYSIQATRRTIAKLWNTLGHPLLAQLISRYLGAQMYATFQCCQPCLKGQQLQTIMGISA